MTNDVVIDKVSEAVKPTGWGLGSSPPTCPKNNNCAFILARNKSSKQDLESGNLLKNLK
jgi:hypothetical protein